MKLIEKLIKFYLTDERIVSLKSKYSNSKFILECLKKNKIENKNFFLINKYKNYQISDLVKRCSKAVNSIDIIILTLGLDGHIASIFDNHLPLKKKKIKIFLS